MVWFRWGQLHTNSISFIATDVSIPALKTLHHEVFHQALTQPEGSGVQTVSSHWGMCKLQRRWKTFEIGGANDLCACLRTHMVGGSGGMLHPRSPAWHFMTRIVV